MESSTTPGTIYPVALDACSCPAGARGLVCKHRAVLAAQLGLLPLDEPERVTFDGTSDRVTVQVDGWHHGVATYFADAGWVFYRGTFPRARRVGSFATLEELRNDLMSRLPIAFRVRPEVQVVASMLATSEMADAVA